MSTPEECTGCRLLAEAGWTEEEVRQAHEEDRSEALMPENYHADGKDEVGS